MKRNKLLIVILVIIVVAVYVELFGDDFKLFVYTVNKEPIDGAVVSLPFLAASTF